jgi:quercetin dioxygenase-like cupin family protein
MTKAAGVLVALLGLAPMPLSAQTAPIIEVEAEPHHHLVLRNESVKVYAVTLASHDAFLMHRHDHDDIVIVLQDATTVSASPGRADILRISKAGEVRFSPRDLVHSVRNIGPGPYSFTGVELLQTQTGPRNLCGKQIPDSPPDCPPAATMADAGTPRVDVPQFETGQIQVTLARILPRQQARFGEAGRDELIVPLSAAKISATRGKGPETTLAPGEPVWLPRGRMRRKISNDSDAMLSIVVVSVKP